MNCELEMAFHSYPQRSYSGVAQQVEQSLCKRWVGGSIPSAGAINKQLSQKILRKRVYKPERSFYIRIKQKKDLDRESDLHIEIFGFIFTVP